MRWCPDIFTLYTLVQQLLCTVTVGMTSLSPSPGLGMEWIVEPPDKMEMGQVHNVSYRATATSALHVIFPGM